MTIKKTDLTVCQIVRFTRLFALDTKNMKPNDDAMKGMNSKNSQFRFTGLVLAH